MKVKYFKKVMFSLVFVFALITKSLACDIKIEIEKGKKDKYQINDEIVVNVKIHLIHRNCNVDIKNTKFQVDGLKVIGQKDWIEVSPGVWERKLKIKVIGNKEGKPKFSVYRVCDREGGQATITLESEKI